MGTILSSRMKDSSTVIFEIALDYDEAVQLKGHMDNVHLFSENVADTETNISQRGKNDATKYFLIPKDLRNDLEFESTTHCQRIETNSKTVFVFLMNKKKNEIK